MKTLYPKTLITIGLRAHTHTHTHTHVTAMLYFRHSYTCIAEFHPVVLANYPYHGPLVKFRLLVNILILPIIIYFTDSMYLPLLITFRQSAYFSNCCISTILSSWLHCVIQHCTASSMWFSKFKTAFIIAALAFPNPNWVPRCLLSFCYLNLLVRMVNTSETSVLKSYSPVP
jgi:hypothetical protein